jgi:hypothetical protein
MKRENKHRKNKIEIDILQSKLQSIRESKIRGIVTRAKAKWRTEGGKCSRYFCNLEKRHYTQKIIPKLISQDGTEKTNFKFIFFISRSLIFFSFLLNRFFYPPFLFISLPFLV